MSRSLRAVHELQASAKALAQEQRLLAKAVSHALEQTVGFDLDMQERGFIKAPRNPKLIALMKNVTRNGRTHLQRYWTAPQTPVAPSRPIAIRQPMAYSGGVEAKMNTKIPAGGLFHKYHNQVKPQPAYVSIDLERKGEGAIAALGADYDAETGGGTPEHMYHNRTLTLSVPPNVNSEALNDLMYSDEFLALVETVLNDSEVTHNGRNYVGRTGPDADSALEQMQGMLDELDTVDVWDAQDWLREWVRTDENAGLTTIFGRVVTPDNANEIIAEAEPQDGEIVHDLKAFVMDIAEQNAAVLVEPNDTFYVDGSREDLLRARAIETVAKYVFGGDDTSYDRLPRLKAQNLELLHVRVEGDNTNADFEALIDGGAYDRIMRAPLGELEEMTGLR